jgi:hypothetical protein
MLSAMSLSFFVTGKDNHAQLNTAAGRRPFPCSAGCSAGCTGVTANRIGRTRGVASVTQIAFSLGFFAFFLSFFFFFLH